MARALIVVTVMSPSTREYTDRLVEDLDDERCRHVVLPGAARVGEHPAIVAARPTFEAKLVGLGPS